MSWKNLFRRLTGKRRSGGLDSRKPPDDAGHDSASDSASRHPAARLVIGLDFGTSFSKVVVGGAADRYAVPFDAYAVDNNPCLLPSCLRIASDSQECMLGTEGHDGEVFDNLKMPLIERDFSDEIRARATAFLALILQHTRDWLLEAHGAVYRNRNRQWFINVGLPTESDDDEKLKNAYRSIVRSAWRLSRVQPGEVTLPGALRCITQDDSRRGGGQMDDPSKDLPDDRFGVFPEFAAQIAGYVRSPLGRDGLHANVDVGGGTLDFTVFNVVRENGEFLYPIFDRRVQPFGVRYLLAERFNTLAMNQDRFHSPFEDLPSDRDFIATHGLSEDELKRLDAPFRKKIQETITESLQYVKRCRDPRAEHWAHSSSQYGAGLRSFFCGGGVLSDFFSRLLYEFEEKPPALKLRSVKLPPPDDLRMPDGLAENGYARLAVAYGLASDPYDIGKIKPMSKIDDESPDPPQSDFGSAYVGKELT